MLVKRLVCIEDLGNVDVLFTDKTGALTAGRIDYTRAVRPARQPAKPQPAGMRSGVAVGLVATENVGADGAAVGGNPLDQALWASPDVAGQLAAVTAYARLGVLPFDHERSMVSVLVKDGKQRLTLVT